MTTVRVTYWRDIPVLVTARDERDEVTVPLPPAFQDLVDRVAVQDGVTDADAYLAEWRVGPDEPRSEPARAAAGAVVDALAAEIEPLRARYLGGPPTSPAA
jgi:Virulence factor